MFKLSRSQILFTFIITLIVISILMSCNIASRSVNDNSSSETESKPINTLTPDEPHPSIPSIPEPESESIEESLTEEIESTTADITDNTTDNSDPEEEFWKQCMIEYPIATEIWLQMKSYGWSDAACAGIMGNIMRETGGDTLRDIQYHIYSKSGNYYGLCQWSLKYYPDIRPTENWIPSIEEQIYFLRYTILNQKELSHSYGFTEGYLLTANSYTDVARVFCEGYERPAGSSYQREVNAEVAWKYFVLPRAHLTELS